MERFVDVPGGRLFVASDGEGPVIVLIHAAVADHRAWDAMIPGLAGKYRVVRYDYRGFGETTTEDVDFSNRADLIAVLDALEIGRAALVGNSRGGMIAFDTAIELPERVVAVVGVGAGLGGFWPDATPAEQALFDEGDALEAAEPRDLDAIADFSVRSPDGWPGPAARSRGSGSPRGTAGDAPAALRAGARPRPSDPARPAGQRSPGRAALPRAGGRRRAGLHRVPADRAPHRSRRPQRPRRDRPDVAHLIGMEVPDRLNALLLDFLAPLGVWR